MKLAFVVKRMNGVGRFPSGKRLRFVAAIAVMFVSPHASFAATNQPRTAPGSPLRFVAPAAPNRVSEGRVVEVRRASRELVVQTPRGATERIVVPRATVIHAPHAGAGLSAIHAGMVVHAEGPADSGRRLVARTISAR
jgi:hypothetical protein